MPKAKSMNTGACVAGVLLLFIGMGGCAQAARTLSLPDAVAAALARDALVQDAQQSVEDAKVALLHVRAHTPKVSLSTDSSSSVSNSLDPESAVTGIPASAVGAFASRWQPAWDSSGGSALLPQGMQLPGMSDLVLMVSWPALFGAMALALVVGVAAALAPATEAAAVVPAQAISQRGRQAGARRFLTCLQVALGVLVLVLLTGVYTLLETQERADARGALGRIPSRPPRTPSPSCTERFPIVTCSSAETPWPA